MRSTRLSMSAGERVGGVTSWVDGSELVAGGLFPASDSVLDGSTSEVDVPGSGRSKTPNTPGRDKTSLANSGLSKSRIFASIASRSEKLSRRVRNMLLSRFSSLSLFTRDFLYG